MDANWKRQLDELHTDLLRRNDPAELVAETDAMEASSRYPYLAVRGPVYGIAVQEPVSGPCWRVVKPVVLSSPQQARDALNSLLWFEAKDGTDDPAVRGELLTAVRTLEQEQVNELRVRGRCYRVVRGDEFARLGEGGLEPPRPSDREPAVRDWDSGRPGLRPDCPLLDRDLVLDPDHLGSSPMGAALRLGLRDFAYTDPALPIKVRAESRRAVKAYPRVVLLQTGYGVVERENRGLLPYGGVLPTPHHARRWLYDALRETLPLIHRLDQRQSSIYAKSAAEFRAAKRANEIEVDGNTFQVCRLERLVRMGADGPEGPRATDQDSHGPSQLHPTMAADGTLNYDD